MLPLGHHQYLQQRYLTPEITLSVTIVSPHNLRIMSMASPISLTLSITIVSPHNFRVISRASPMFTAKISKSRDYSEYHHSLSAQSPCYLKGITNISSKRYLTQGITLSITIVSPYNLRVISWASPIFTAKISISRDYHTYHPTISA